MEWQAGTTVAVAHRTGMYVGTIVEEAKPRALIEIAAVLRHPEQGDLHHPYEPDVPMFHQRRASAQREKVWVFVRDVAAWNGEVPPYDASLRQALDEQEHHLQQLAQGLIRTDRDGSHIPSRVGDEALRRWAEQALQQVQALRRDYWG